MDFLSPSRVGGFFGYGIFITIMSLGLPKGRGVVSINYNL